MTMVQVGNGKRQCEMNDWVTTHWKAYDHHTGEILQDTRAKEGAKPKLFRIGHF